DAHLGRGRLDEGDHAAAEPLVRHADDRGAGDTWAARERALDLLGIDVLAATDDHVVDAADHVELAVLVELAEIAGAVPSALDRLGVGIRPLPVAGDRPRARHAGDDLARHARRQIDFDRVAPRRIDHADHLVEAGAPGAARLLALMVADRESVDL